MKSAKDSTIVYEAVPKAPPFSQLTWLRPVITPFGGYSLAGSRSNFDLIDVVMTFPATGYVASRMSCDRELRPIRGSRHPRYSVPYQNGIRDRSRRA